MIANSFRTSRRTRRVPRACATLFIAALLGGCGLGHASTTTFTTQTTRNLDANAAPPDSYRGRRHRRHGRHRSTGGSQTAAMAAGATVAGGAAVAAAAARPAATGSGAYPCNNAQFLGYQSQFANGTLHGDQEVDVCGTVTRVLAEKDTRSGVHGYYELQVAPGSTIEIVSDLGEMDAPAWPWVNVGDYSYVQGRYYYDSPSSQGIDWTHHGTSNSWPTPGYVVVAGTQYR